MFNTSLQVKCYIGSFNLDCVIEETGVQEAKSGEDKL